MQFLSLVRSEIEVQKMKKFAGLKISFLITALRRISTATANAVKSKTKYAKE